MGFCGAFEDFFEVRMLIGDLKLMEFSFLISKLLFEGFLGNVRQFQERL